METTPEPVEELPVAMDADAKPHFAAEYLFALLHARIEARKRREGEPQDVAVDVERSTDR